MARLVKPRQPLVRPYFAIWLLDEQGGRGSEWLYGHVNARTESGAIRRARALGLKGHVLRAEQYPDPEYCKRFPDNCKGTEKGKEELGP